MEPIKGTPPARTGRPLAYAQAVKLMRENPDEWFLIAEWPDSKPAVQTAANIRRGKMAAFREGKWESAARNGQLWVRFVSEEKVSDSS